MSEKSIRFNMNDRNMYVRCAYWGKWSRVLSVKNRQYLELDLTGTNGRWEKVREMNVRLHCTAPAKNDEYAHTLPAHVMDRMIENLGTELVNILLGYDFVKYGNWDKYREFSNGGVPYMKLSRFKTLHMSCDATGNCECYTPRA